MTPYLLLALAWLGYFALHSLLASLAVKRWVAARRPAALRLYRLAFNGVAVAALLPLLAYMHSLQGEWLWRWQGPARWLADGAAVLALLGFLWSLRWYDGREFLGLRQLRERTATVEDQERFHLSPLHRYVRHPWYSLGLVLVWSRDMEPALLLSALLITGYFALGSELEERKLIAYHGERYRRYRARVPRLLPSPWRRLSAAEAGELVGGRG